KYVIDHQLLRGATNFVFSNIPHGCYGKLLSAGCRPKFGTSHPFWDWFDTLHTYTAGMAAMLSLGTPEVNTLLYFDVPSIWCGASIMDKAVKEHFRSAEELLKRHVDFDFADDDALAGGKIVNGRFQVGVLSYDTLVIPAENRMFPEAARMVESFRQQGGRVLTTGELDQIAPVMGIRSKSNALRAVKRRSGKETLYFITNESDRDVKAELTFGEAGLVQFLDGWKVKRYALPCENQTLSWNFEPFGSALFVINSEAEPDAPYPFFRGGKKKLLLKENWTIQPVRKCVYTTDDTYEIRTLDEQPCPVQLGDWRKVLGEYFSGEALYRTEFDSPSDQKAKLSLGEICYVAQVTLNGKDLGKTFSGKAEFFTEGILKKGKNILEVRVVNTPANAISDPELKAHWKANHPPSLFQEMQYIFESESLESGLLGPVTLHFAAKSE
ncbi:MAG: hypothetical protein J6S58_03595, partial [Lentisphaeria bacterium]|nr:hypothetical protein [Lentisphaeria bacterium]